jgi:hypothetical protein
MFPKNKDIQKCNIYVTFLKTLKALHALLCLFLLRDLSSQYLARISPHRREIHPMHDFCMIELTLQGKCMYK